MHCVHSVRRYSNYRLNASTLSRLHEKKRINSRKNCNFAKNLKFENCGKYTVATF